MWPAKGSPITQAPAALLSEGFWALGNTTPLSDAEIRPWDFNGETHDIEAVILTEEGRKKHGHSDQNWLWTWG